ncbi:GDSL-type esterase/lipase family protein [Thiocapsa sp.]|uniref:GDSL-type esterase/lipase family protein n=1 Tax=Thiocapsa sp. TaxID=2024551 RepID=UPI001BCAB757
MDIAAADPDGPAPLVLGAAPLPGTAAFTDNGDGTGRLIWTPSAGDVAASPYSLVVTASDGAGATDSETVAVTVLPASGGTGQLQTTLSATASPVNLTAEGTLDWVHWGRSTPTDVNRKADAAAQIGTLTSIDGTGFGRFSNGGRPAYTWSDGTPTASATTNAGVALAGAGRGYALTVPADTEARTLVVYVGGWNSNSRLDVSLSDGSAAPYSVALSPSDGNPLRDDYDVRLAITYQAASAGQTLNLRYEQTSAGGTVNFMAATLQGGGSAPVNQPPQLDPIGNRTVQVGATLTVDIDAADPDGPAPLVLGAAPLPGTAAFTDNGDGTGRLIWTPSAGDVAASPYSLVVTASDGAGATDSETVAVTVLPASGGTGQLQTTLSATASPVNLTAEGTLDWVHWGRSTPTDVNRKAGTAAQIGALTSFGGATVGRFNNTSRPAYSWSDGTPRVTATTYAGLQISGAGRGYTLTAPADTSVRTLVVYVGGWNTIGRLEASLTDGSAVPYSVTVSPLDDDPLRDDYDVRFAITYQAASAGQTLTLRYSVESGSGVLNFAAATLQGTAASAMELPFADDFSDPLMAGWIVADETPVASNWTVIGGQLRQTTALSANFVEAYHLGSYAYLSNGFALADYKISMDAEYLATNIGSDIGMLVRFRDPGNYYRISINSRYGFTRLEKRVNGTFSSLATDSRGVFPGELLQIEVEVNGSTISVRRNGEPIFAVTDTSHASGTVGLYTDGQVSFANVAISAPPELPAITLNKPLAYLTEQADGSLIASAITSNAPEGSRVRFALSQNNGAGITEIDSLFDSTPPYEVDFFATAGNYEVRATLLDSSGVALASDTNSNIGVGGEYLVGVGDSITNGTGDNYRSDNISALGRVVAFRGYQAVLTDLLDITQPPQTNIVFNEGIPGDTSTNLTSLRISAIQARHPELETALVMIGTNDANRVLFTPSGLGCSGSSCTGTYKGNVQELVDKLRWSDYPLNTQPSGVTPVVALPPPAWNSDTPWTSTVNNRIRDYIRVIEEELVGIVIGPNFFDFFMPSANTDYRSLFSDTLHPNGLGYYVMSYLWHEALNRDNPSALLPLPFVLQGLTVPSAPQAQQNLLEIGNPYQLDTDFRLVSVPSELDRGRWIMLPNADIGNSANGYLSFEVDRDVDVYIAYDSAATALPPWLVSFDPTSATVVTSNPIAGSLRLYRKTVTASSSAPVLITLGGNTGSMTGANTNYVVIVVEK